MKIPIAKTKLTDKEYAESKEISFRILYGGIPKEFLKKVHK